MKPHLVETWKLPTDPQFVDKVCDVVGLYLDPPEKAIVLCVDEKSQIQAIDCTDPAGHAGCTGTDAPRRRPLWHHQPVRRGGPDQRRGQRQPYRRHRHQEFLGFLELLDTSVPAGYDLPLILGNYATHKTPAIKRWLRRRPRFHLHVTPTWASAMNLVERWFAELTTGKLRRAAHRLVTELEADLRRWINVWNTDPKPLVWTKTADEILNTLTAYC